MRKVAFSCLLRSLACGHPLALVHMFPNLILSDTTSMGGPACFGSLTYLVDVCDGFGDAARACVAEASGSSGSFKTLLGLEDVRGPPRGEPW